MSKPKKNDPNSYFTDGDEDYDIDYDMDVDEEHEPDSWPMDDEEYYGDEL